MEKSKASNRYSPEVQSRAVRMVLEYQGSYETQLATIHMMYYNFVKLHSKLKVTPAMAAGVSDKLWEIGDIVALVHAEEAKVDRKRGSYRKTQNPSP